MRRIIRSAVALTVGFGGTLTVASANRLNSARHDERLGSLNMFQACRDQFGEGAQATLVSDDAFGWRCAIKPNGIFSTVGINADGACTKQYQTSAYGRPTVRTSPDSWECFRR